MCGVRIGRRLLQLRCQSTTQYVDALDWFIRQVYVMDVPHNEKYERKRSEAEAELAELLPFVKTIWSCSQASPT